MSSFLIADCLSGASLVLSGTALGISVSAFLTVRRAMGAINDMVKPIGEAVRFERARRDAVKRTEGAVEGAQPLGHVVIDRPQAAVFERAVSTKDGVIIMESRETLNARLRASNAPPPPPPQPEVRLPR